MPDTPTTVDAYLHALPDDRRAALETVRTAILDHLPDGYVESMTWGMPTYEVPLDTYPDTYNGKPLMYAALASQKRHMAVYLTGIYMEEAARADFEARYRATGKRFDVGKSCVRFRTVDDLPLDLIADAIAAIDVDTFVERTKAVHAARKK